MNKIILTIIIGSGLYFLPMSYSNVSTAYAAAEAKKSIKVPAMRNRVYTQLARAQQLADEGQKLEGFEVLGQVKERIDSLNSYEKAMLWNFYGFMYYGNNDLAMAIDCFQKVIKQETIPEPLRLSTLYSLAQLTMQLEDYKQTLVHLRQWQSLNSKSLTSDQHMLFAQVHYQNKSYELSLSAVEAALVIAKHKNQTAKENWLILQRANYYELDKPVKVTQVLEQLVKYYSNPTYWLQLSGMYGEIGEEAQQLATMEAAWQAGYISKSQDIITLAQLYRFNGVPYKAAALLEEAIEQGKVVPSEQHLEMLAQSYLAAKSGQKSLPAFIKASVISDSGKIDAQLAQVYLNLEKWQLAIRSADKALSRKGINRIGDMHLIIGMSHFNLKNYDQALIAFEAAKAITNTAKAAQQWSKYVKREQGHQAQLAMLN